MKNRDYALVSEFVEFVDPTEWHVVPGEEALERLLRCLLDFKAEVLPIYLVRLGLPGNGKVALGPVQPLMGRS